MGSDHINDDSSSERAAPSPGFWRRQFTTSATETQNIWDVFFGVIAPVLCFIFDPVVLKGGTFGGGDGLLQGYQLFVYAVSFLQITSLIGWFVIGRRMKGTAAVLGGVLIAGAIFSIVIGFEILPYSPIGLAFGIGVLGFVPFLTAIAYLRNGIRALKHSGKNWTAANVLLTVLLGSALGLGLPAASSTYASRVCTESVDSILTGNAEQAEAAAHRLRHFWIIPSHEAERLVNTYWTTEIQWRRKIIASSYQVIYDESIDRTFANHD